VIFRRDERERALAAVTMGDEVGRPLWQNAIYFSAMVGILVFANWGRPVGEGGVWALIYHLKWELTAFCGMILGLVLVAWFGVRWWKMAIVVAVVSAVVLILPGVPLAAFAAGLFGLSLITATDAGENGEWFASSWGFAKQIFPLLLAGVLVAGLLLGRVGGEGLIPSEWVSRAVGGNSFRANFFASFAGAFMYFATLTEVPILQGLIGNGMGKGPALALLLAGPALSLPNMLVIRSVLGTKKTLVFVSLVIVMATMSGMLYGHF